MPKILLIDDEPPIRRMLKKFFESYAYDVISAENGIQGIAQYHEHHPDLIITDLIMPDKEGLETINELKKNNPDIKIIAMSGGGVTDPEMYLNLARQLGAIKTFTKPIKNSDLLLAVKDIIG